MFEILVGRRYGDKALAMGLTWCLLATASVFVRAEEPGDEYRAAVEARAAQAEQSGDPIQMIEVAFALYPLDAQKSRSTALVNKAVDVTLAKKDRKLAGRVLELSSSLSGEIVAEKRDRLQELAIGKSVAEQVAQQTDKSGPDLRKYGPDLGNPDIKGRGDVEKRTAESLGEAVLFFCRPSAALGDTEMTGYNWKQLRGDRLVVTAEFRWYGFFTENPYDSEIQIVFLGDDPPEVISISYDDDCPTPCENLKKLKELIALMNKQLQS